jgi:hypothetical protein
MTFEVCAVIFVAVIIVIAIITAIRIAPVHIENPYKEDDCIITHYTIEKDKLVAHLSSGSKWIIHKDDMTKTEEFVYKTLSKEEK